MVTTFWCSTLLNVFKMTSPLPFHLIQNLSASEMISLHYNYILCDVLHSSKCLSNDVIFFMESYSKFEWKWNDFFIVVFHKVTCRWCELMVWVFATCFIHNEISVLKLDTLMKFDVKSQGEWWSHRFWWSQSTWPNPLIMCDSIIVNCNFKRLYCCWWFAHYTTKCLRNYPPNEIWN